MDRHTNPGRVAALCALLAVVTLITFWPVAHHEFINYDDPDYVVENDWVTNGLSWEGVEWAFTTGHASNWHPITWLSHMLDVQWFGMDASKHHLTNLLFHTANTVLLLLLLWQMTGAVWRSTFVAALFALHPLHVESVAWVAERKDLLSAFFGLLCLMTYARFAQCTAQTSKCKNLWYVVSLLMLALGLMSKPMLVTWPFVMLLLDFWPLRRIEQSNLTMLLPTLKRLAVEKIPFLVLVAISCFVTLGVQENAMPSMAGLPLSDRVGNAILACATYLKQALRPTNLAVFYPYVLPLGVNPLIVASMFLLVATIIVLRLARKHPFTFVGWFWYLGTLIPVIGLVQVGSQARADRYTYLPLIGIFILIAWAGSHLGTLHRQIKIIVLPLAALAVIALAIATRSQLQHWKNSETLFTHATRVTDGNFIAWAGLGIVEYHRDNYDKAVQNLMQALEYAPTGKPTDQIRFYLGATLQKQGKGREALPFLENAVVVGALEPERNYRLGLSLLEAGRVDEAESALNLACQARPGNPDFLLGKGALLAQRGQIPEAGQLFTNVIATNPESWLAHYTLAGFLTQQGRPEEAESPFAKAVSLSPKDAKLRQAYASCLISLGKLELARTELEEARRLDPKNPQFSFDLAEVLNTQGQIGQAVKLYEQAILESPDHIPALNNLAWLLATTADDRVRNGARAVELAERACQFTDWKAAVLIGTLAASYAEAGRFPEAAAMAERARDLAREENQENVATRNEQLLQLYKSGKPFRGKIK